MPLSSKDVIIGSSLNLTDKDIDDCINRARSIAPNIKDRKDLHARDFTERFLNVLQGEIAELMVIKWLQTNGKFAESAVDKNSQIPDLGHDIHIKNKESGDIVTCSVKSSVSVFKDVENILSEFRLATKKSEVREVNIQVYFWLKVSGAGINDKNRQTYLNLESSAIIAWAGKLDFKDSKDFGKYNTEEREASTKKLKEHRSMKSLLNYII